MNGNGPCSRKSSARDRFRSRNRCAAAIRFAEEGARVVVSDANTNGGNETVARIKQSGGDAVFVSADVAKAAEVEALVASVVDNYGRLDCACNNAGIEGKVVPIIDQSEDNFDQVMSQCPNVRGWADANILKRREK